MQTFTCSCLADSPEEGPSTILSLMEFWFPFPLSPLACLGLLIWLYWHIFCQQNVPEIHTCPNFPPLPSGTRWWTCKHCHCRRQTQPLHCWTRPQVCPPACKGWWEYVASRRRQSSPISHGGVEALKEDRRQWRLREDRPGLVFIFIICDSSRPWGAVVFYFRFVFVYFIIKLCVECSPVPAYSFPYLISNFITVLGNTLEYGSFINE